MAEKENGEKVFTAVVDSGRRQEFETGSARDTDVGKGNPNLIPSLVHFTVSKLKLDDDFKNMTLKQHFDCMMDILWRWAESGLTGDIEEDCLEWALAHSLVIASNGNINYDSFYPFSKGLKKLGIHYQHGAVKYGNWNWTRGQPLSRYFDSLIRHIWAYAEGKDDEAHDAAICWNLVAILQTQQDIKNEFVPNELDDMPYTKEDLYGKK